MLKLVVQRGIVTVGTGDKRRPQLLCPIKRLRSPPFVLVPTPFVTINAFVPGPQLYNTMPLYKSKKPNEGKKSTVLSKIWGLVIY